MFLFRRNSRDLDAGPASTSAPQASRSGSSIGYTGGGEPIEVHIVGTLDVGCVLTAKCVMPKGAGCPLCRERAHGGVLFFIQKAWWAEAVQQLDGGSTRELEPPG